MYSDFYSTPAPINVGVDGTWMIVAAVLALVGGIVGYALFVAKKNEYNGFLGWFHEFLNFKSFFVEVILKVSYLVLAIYITLSSFGYIRLSVASFFIVLIFGNIILRIVYEFMLMTITMVRNTTEINKKLDVLKKDSSTKSKKNSDE